MSLLVICCLLFNTDSESAQDDDNYILKIKTNTGKGRAKKLPPPIFRAAREKKGKEITRGRPKKNSKSSSSNDTLELLLNFGCYGSQKEKK